MYILSADWQNEDNPNAVVEANTRYQKYLSDNKHRFPLSAFEFASAEWHHNFRDHKALHDSWLVDVSIQESDSKENRVTDITLKLLGAYHDGHMFIKYSNVKSYQIGSSTSKHTSIDRDEVRLSENGHVLHEIVWWQDFVWLIECKDITYTWVSV